MKARALRHRPFSYSVFPECHPGAFASHPGGGQSMKMRGAMWPRPKASALPLDHHWPAPDVLRPDNPRQMVQHRWIDDAPRRMTPLRPGIGKHDIGPGEASVRQALQNEANIIIPDKDILKAALCNVTKQRGDAVDKRFCTNEACLWTRRGRPARCSPPPKPISRNMSRGALANWRCGDLAGSKRSGGKFSASNVCKFWLSGRPLRRP